MIRFNPVSPGFASGLTRGLPFILAAGLLTACMGPTPYQPRLEGQSTGYTDRALTQNRYRVTFTGNSATPRETVESYLLLRAAEVTRAAGYASFMFDSHHVPHLPLSCTCPCWKRVCQARFETHALNQRARLHPRSPALANCISKICCKRIV